MSTTSKTTEWQKFLDQCSLQHDKRLSKQRVEELTLILFKALDSNEREITIQRLSPAERRWIHERSRATNVVSTSLEHTRQNDLKDVIINKPENWNFDQIIRSNPPENLEKLLKKDQIRRVRERKTKEMEAWSTNCEECGSSLSAHEALYHWSGMGPLCEDCVESDDDLCGLKWESKASFWC